MITDPADVTDERRLELEGILRQKALNYGFHEDDLESARYRWSGKGKNLVRLMEVKDKTFTAGVNVTFNRIRPVRDENVPPHGSLPPAEAARLLEGMQAFEKARELLEPFDIDVRLDVKK